MSKTSTASHTDGNMTLHGTHTHTQGSFVSKLAVHAGIPR